MYVLCSYSLHLKVFTPEYTVLHVFYFVTMILGESKDGKENKKTKALKFLALKSAAFLAWNLDILEKK